MAIKIVPASEDLVAEVEVWLDAEERAYRVADEAWETGGWQGTRPRRGFRCNWDSVKTGWREEDHALDILVRDEAAIGFLYRAFIMEIHPAYRGRNYGVLLADFMLRRAKGDGYSVLEIEISPREAESFWIRQGFVPDHARLEERGALHAHLVIPRTFDLGQGPRVPVEIEFYDEGAAFGRQPPFSRFVGEGERLPDGSIQLPERIHGSDHTLRSNIENHVRIIVGGEEIYFGRAKYGRAFGAAKDPGGAHYIDRVTVPAKQGQ